MKNINELIEENLPGLWEEVKIACQDNKDLADDLIHHYKGVVKSMLQDYAIDVLDEVETKRSWTPESFNEFKQQIEQQ